MQKDNSIIMKRCLNCGNYFVPNGNSQKFCSPECRYQAEQSRRPSEAVQEERFCERCGEQFVSKRADQKYCSDRCRNRMKQIKHRIHKPNVDRVSSEVDKTITLYALIKRDKNICQICNEECDLYDYEVSETGTMNCGDKYPTIDHIRPCSKGGSHTWDNVQLACLKCNIIKGDKYDGP